MLVIDFRNAITWVLLSWEVTGSVQWCCIIRELVKVLLPSVYSSGRVRDDASILFPKLPPTWVDNFHLIGDKTPNTL